MEWIEVSAKTLDDARELALDRLGVVADELEYEVIDQPKGGLFGIGRTEARIRARVRPISREKPTDRRRRRSSERRPSGGSRKPRGDSSQNRGEPKTARPAGDDSDAERKPAGTGTSASSRRRRRGRGGSGTAAAAATTSEKSRTKSNEDRAEAKVNVDTDVEDGDVEAQAERAEAFTRSLVEAFGLTGTVSARVEDETVLVAVEGEGLGSARGPAWLDPAGDRRVGARRGAARAERPERSTPG